MKAVIHTRYGSPEVLRVVDLPVPGPKDDEVLIKVHMSTLNRTDTGFRSASYAVSRFITGILRPKKQTTGTEFAGEIVKIGKDVTDYKVGDKVFGFDDATFGAHAEYKVEPSGGPMAKIPKGLSYRDVAAAGEGATYALNTIAAAPVKKGQNVLIYGASGAIGTAAVQICKHFGATVTAVCGTKNVELVRSLGADSVVDYQTQSFTELTERFDFIFDTVGKITYQTCKKMLKPNGKFASTEPGFLGQNIFLALWFAVTRQRKVIFPIPKINKQNIEFIKKLLKSGEFKSVIDRTYNLEEVVSASEYVETKQKTGNVLIKIV